MDTLTCNCCTETYVYGPGLSSCYNSPAVVHAHLIEYLAFLDKEMGIQEFLVYDICSTYADKYLLAIVYKYFMRINLLPAFYNKGLFFTALHLARDVFEETDEDIRYELFMWSIGPDYEVFRKQFSYLKKKLFFELRQKTLVCREWCERLFELVPDHPAWQRNREQGHAGVLLPRMELVNGAFAMRRSPGSCRHCMRRNQMLVAAPAPVLDQTEE